MESQKLVGVAGGNFLPSGGVREDRESFDAARGSVVAPITSDSSRLIPWAGLVDNSGAESALLDSDIEMLGDDDVIPSGEMFGDGDGDHTAVNPLKFELRSRFTARRSSMIDLMAMFEAAVARADLGRFAVVVGEPGMGKTHLLAELVRRTKTHASGPLVLRAAAGDSAAPLSPPFATMIRALSSWFGLVAGEDNAKSRDRIAASVADVMPATRVPEVAHLVAHMMGVPFVDSPVIGPLADAPQRLETRIFMAVRRLLAAIAERTPVLIVLENLESAGAETINLVQYLAAGLVASPVMIATSATPALFERHPSFGDGDAAAKRIDLTALSADDAEALLRDLLRTIDDIPASVVRHARELGGLPRAVHEYVRLLLESDCIVRGDGLTWRFDVTRLGKLTLPRTYDELIATRLAMMPPLERRVIEMAAVVGEMCWLDVLIAIDRTQSTQGRDPDGPTLAQIAKIGDDARNAVTSAISKLIESEWLVDVATTSLAGEREMRFSYPSLWTIVYRGIEDSRRRIYHATAARWLELRPDARGASAAPEIARHLELAGEPQKAAARYRQAAEAARENYSNEQAIRYFDRALACIGDADIAARIHLWHDLGSVYELIGDFEAALGAFERMLRLSWLAASKTKAAVAFNKMGRVWRRKGDLRLALEYLGRGLDLFRTADDERGIAGSLDDVGKALQFLGRYDEAFAKITEALARRGKSGDPRSIASSLSNLGAVQHDRGNFDAAFHCHQEALELRRSAGDRLGVIVSQNNLAVLSFELGDFADARVGWTLALADAEAIGALPMSALVLTNLGELALRQGKHEEAKSRLEDALEIIEDINDKQLETECCRHIATLEMALGHHRAAHELAERALKVAHDAGFLEKEAQAHLTLGELGSASIYDATRDSAPDLRNVAVAPEDEPAVRAAKHFEAALAILRKIGNEAELAKANEAYGRYQIERGEVTGGQKHVKEALAAFTRLGLAKRGADVQALLDQLN